MSQRKPALDGSAVVLIVLCCVVWGLGQVSTKVALAEFGPFTQVAIRSLGAAVLLMAWSRWRGIALVDRDGTWGAGALVGLLFALEFACIFVGLQYTTASRMVVFVYLAPFVVALGMPLVARSERLDRWQLAGLVAAFAGVAWAFAEGFAKPSAGDRQWLGDALGVAGAVLWGATTLAIRATSLSQAAAEKTLFYQLAVSGVAMAVAAFVAGEPWSARFTPWPLAAMGFQAVIVCFVSYLVWFWLIRHYPATQLSAFTLLTPVFGLVAGVMLLGEPMTARLLVALGTVAVGIALVNRLRPAPRTALPASPPQPRQGD
ncbi:MAG: DMT family transporter [Burkholderiaceae bacterium]